jgi:spore coat polysaccharide biosynthesis protein SpsF (cytidylyltransferase family)
MSNRIILIVQARMNSKRFRNKIMFKINKKPLIYWIIKRISQSQLVDKFVVATTTESSDNKFVYWVKTNTTFKIFRGSNKNVLKRFFFCAKKYKAKYIVRITADDPLKDYRIIDKAIKIIINNNKIDYCSNTLQPSYPDGLDVEVFKYAALKKAYLEAKLESEKEHVTPYIWKNKNLFKVINFKYKEDLSKWRLTVDTKKDINIIKKIIMHFKNIIPVPYYKIINYIKENKKIGLVTKIKKNTSYWEQTTYEGIQ